MTAPRDTWDATYRDSSSDGLWGEVELPKISELSERCRLDGCKRILDAGCGDGRNMEYLLKSGFVVLGVDASSSAIEHCRSRMKRLPPVLQNYELVLASLDGIPLADSSIDGAVCMDVLVHVGFNHAVEILSEIRRVVKPGRLILFNLCTDREPSATERDMQSVDTLTAWYRPTATQQEYLYELYDEGRLRELLERADIPASREILHRRWQDPAHPGFRDYPHEHDGWFVQFKNESGLKSSSIEEPL